MKNKIANLTAFIIFIIQITAVVFNMLYAEEVQKDYPIKQVLFSEVRITQGFWTPILQTSLKVTIPYAFKMCEETGRINNFAKAGGLMKGEFEGRFFNDSDLYKILEGAGYSLAVHPDLKFEKYVDNVIDKIASAQWKDGYLYTFYSVPERQQKKRWTNMNLHELYCAGHFFEAAVAYYHATGKRKILDVAIRLADYINSVFGPGKNPEPPGHQEIELGLVKLFHVTGKKKYLDLAKFFLDQRGNTNREIIIKRGGGSHGHQDHKPVVQQEEAIGHAVRAMYMYSGMADIAALTGDTAYTKAVERLWHNVADKKLYITGGIGGGVGEGFNLNYRLPNNIAYNETCAAIANVLWNHRMFLLSEDSKYIDVLERTLYNGLISGVSLKGDRFFYPNTLETRSGRERKPWFKCACCPSNIARFIPSVPGYVYAINNNTLYVNLFIGSSVKVKMAGQAVEIKQKTDYPWDGKVKITIEPQKSSKFTVAVRIPGWARNKPVPGDLYRYLKKSDQKPVIKVNGKQASIKLEKGFVCISRTWKKNDVIDLDLPMPVRRILAHREVGENGGRVAIQRGPIVFCMEGIDNKKIKGDSMNLLIPDNSKFETKYNKDLLNGVVVINGNAFEVMRGIDKVSIEQKKHDLVLIPYYAWANREQSPMTVWMLRDKKMAILPPVPTIASFSKVSVSSAKGDFRALYDQIEPAASGDTSRGVFSWRCPNKNKKTGKIKYLPCKGTTEWVEYEFKKKEKVSKVEVYWADRFGSLIRIPKSWKLLYLDGKEWKPVRNSSPYEILKDQFNTVTFQVVETKALRLEADLQDSYMEEYFPRKGDKPKRVSAGILEWRVE